MTNDCVNCISVDDEIQCSTCGISDYSVDFYDGDDYSESLYIADED